MRNGQLNAFFVTFSANVAKDGASTPNALDGTDAYVLSDGGGTIAIASFLDDILGQASAAHSDFVANDINDAAPPSVNGAYDVISNNSPTTGTGFSGGLLTTGVDPKLGPLSSNGGPTETMALLAGSPALARRGTDRRPDLRPLDHDRPARRSPRQPAGRRRL